MKDNFEACLKVTLQQEGGWSNNPHDPGGQTMKGVTQRTYNDYRNRHGLAFQSVKYIGDAELQDLYRVGYWNPINGDNIAKGLDLMTFDTCVNSSSVEARRLYSQLPQGSPTTKIIAYGRLRLGFMHRLRTWRWFSKGWTARVNRVQSAALEMIR
jgi:lysozyme family protein